MNTRFRGVRPHTGNPLIMTWVKWVSRSMIMAVDNMMALKDIHIVVSGTCECVPWPSEGKLRIEVKLELFISWSKQRKETLDTGPISIESSPCGREEPQCEAPERCDVGNTEITLHDTEGQTGPRSKKRFYAPESWEKPRHWFSPGGFGKAKQLESPPMNGQQLLANPLTWSHWKPFWTSDLWTWR